MLGTSGTSSSERRCSSPASLAASRSSQWRMCPPAGPGLGSSSAVTVGLHAYQGAYRTEAELAEEASHIEIEVLGNPIGRQDQYAAATGGFNLIEFPSGGQPVQVQPIIVPPGPLERLRRSLLMFYSGGERTPPRSSRVSARPRATVPRCLRSSRCESWPTQCAIPLRRRSGGLW